MFIYVSEDEPTSFTAKATESISLIGPSWASSYHFVAPFDGEFSAMYNKTLCRLQVVGDNGYYTDFGDDSGPPRHNSCECGASSVNSPRHSFYCKLYSEYEYRQ